MADLELRGISKDFGDTQAVRELSLSIKEGEFVVLLGPSGCGKSTILRLICGLEQPTQGDIVLAGRAVNDVSPRERNMAFVFQSYALYPHMTVARNISFPLVMERTNWIHHLPLAGSVMRWRLRRQADITSRVEEIGRLLQIENLLHRYPRALSGGQRQRVALGRAMIRKPEMFLLDEPLSNLDAKLRVEMRTELVKLHKAIGGTFVFVTHDQTEAMTMGTKIAVLKDGLLQQFDTPRKIFDEPANAFVARFVGIPPMNLIDAELDPSGATLQSAGQRFDLPKTPVLEQSTNRRVLLGVRPEHVTLNRASTPRTLQGEVTVVEQLGSEAIIGAFLPGLLNGEGTPSPYGDGVPGDKEVFVRMPGISELEIGDQVWLEPNMDQMQLFCSTDGRRIAFDDET